MSQDEEECLREFRAFASGGSYAIEILNRVWMNIAREYGVNLEKVPGLFKRVGLVMAVSGRIFPVNNDEDGFQTLTRRSTRLNGSFASTPVSTDSSSPVFAWE